MGAATSCRRGFATRVIAARGCARPSGRLRQSAPPRQSRSRATAASGCTSAVGVFTRIFDIFYKDWGAGQPVVFSHGWPLQSDSWESQQLHLADNGFGAIAHDRRGHGRSAQAWDATTWITTPTTLRR
jgi:non-heme chloroperoxidase